MQKKITELNQALIQNGHKDVSLNPAELSILSSLCAHLDKSGATDASESVVGGLDLAVKLTTIWPYSDRLPGLDLLRLLVVAPQTATYSHPRGGSIIDILEAGSSENEPPADNHVMMAIRAFANIFDTEEGRELAVKEFEKIQSIVSSALTRINNNRNVSVAIGTLYINYAVYFSTNSSDNGFDTCVSILETLSKILEKEKDSEAVYRCLVAAGTLAGVNEEVRDVAKDVVGLGKVVDGVMARVKDPRVGRVGREIKGVLG